MNRLLAVAVAVYVLAVSDGARSQGLRRVAEPTIVDLAGNGFSLTGPEDGVAVDIDGDGAVEQVGWTTADSDDAFLCVDHNKNGVIDVPAELVGGTTGPPGFALLTALDGIVSRGRPERVRDRRPNGYIDKADALFYDLILWTDSNHNGRSEEDELQSLEHGGILRIASGYEGVPSVDAFGNQFQYRTHAQAVGGRGVPAVREVVAVRLAQR